MATDQLIDRQKHQQPKPQIETLPLQKRLCNSCDAFDITEPMDFA